MRHDRHSAIGVFDSGVGGLTVLKVLLERLPLESTVYLGDTARVPYGTKSGEVVTKYSLANANMLLEYVGEWKIAHTGYKRLFEEMGPRPEGTRTTASYVGTDGRSSLL